MKILLFISNLIFTVDKKNIALQNSQKEVKITKKTTGLLSITVKNNQKQFFFFGFDIVVSFMFIVNFNNLKSKTDFCGNIDENTVKFSIFNFQTTNS